MDSFVVELILFETACNVSKIDVLVWGSRQRAEFRSNCAESIHHAPLVTSTSTTTTFSTFDQDRNQSSNLNPPKYSQGHRIVHPPNSCLPWPNLLLTSDSPFAWFASGRNLVERATPRALLHSIAARKLLIADHKHPFLGQYLNYMKWDNHRR